MTLTISDVEKWDPAQLATAGASVGKLFADLDTAIAGGVTSVATIGWEGKAAKAAEDRMTVEKLRASEVSQALVALQKALTDQVDNLTNARQAVLDARNRALHPGSDQTPPTEGFEVADNGVVTATARKAYWDNQGTSSDPNSPPALNPLEVQTKSLEEDLKAAQHQSAITNALKQAEIVAEAATKAVGEAKAKVDQAYNRMGDPVTGAGGVTPAPASTAPSSVAAPEVPVAGAPVSNGAGASQLMSGGTSSGGSSSYYSAGGGGGSYGGGSGASSFAGGTSFSGPVSGGPPQEMPSGDVAQWIAEAKRILIEMGYPPEMIDENAIATIIKHESSGNPLIENKWDSNWAAGHSSKGLMQTIDSTFNSYAVDGHRNIYNPVDNIVAATRYAIDRYGSLQDVPGVAAVAQGKPYVGY
ncbi:transglycosylase SLT domain-containing protein [Nocardia transvalensis]|uniref:transglycosylase SLT domain-containing protein n=1 Tax=Nocardia transvalensis TaxID=37333 RepID=UPI001893CD4C|nr:transglycosylase SLT domain-containing protein [Nocardia transvalensis]MBF6330442.1 transglycosylase SLT domain-containing protein [Nocardia transvalensis]